MVDLLSRLFRRVRPRVQGVPVGRAVECGVCHSPDVTWCKRYAPVEGSNYVHTDYSCEAHRTYLDGHSWGTDRGEWRDLGKPVTRCARCNSPLDACGCPASAAHLRWKAWADQAVIYRRGTR